MFVNSLTFSEHVLSFRVHSPSPGVKLTFEAAWWLMMLRNTNTANNLSLPTFTLGHFYLWPVSSFHQLHVLAGGCECTVQCVCVCLPSLCSRCARLFGESYHKHCFWTWIGLWVSLTKEPLLLCHPTQSTECTRDEKKSCHANTSVLINTHREYIFKLRRLTRSIWIIIIIRRLVVWSLSAWQSILEPDPEPWAALRCVNVCLEYETIRISFNQQTNRGWRLDEIQS